MRGLIGIFGAFLKPEVAFKIYFVSTKACFPCFETWLSFLFFLEVKNKTSHSRRKIFFLPSFYIKISIFLLKPNSCNLLSKWFSIAFKRFFQVVTFILRQGNFLWIKSFFFQKLFWFFFKFLSVSRIKKFNIPPNFGFFYFFLFFNLYDRLFKSY